MIIEGNTVKCDCGHKIFDGSVLKVRVAIFSMGYVLPKCPKCKRMNKSFPIEILTKGGNQNERTHN